MSMQPWKYPAEVNGSWETPRTTANYVTISSFQTTSIPYSLITLPFHVTQDTYRGVVTH